MPPLPAPRLALALVVHGCGIAETVVVVADGTPLLHQLDTFEAGARR
jgi:hypothetical protein